jgi:hypothetical protein
LKCIRTLGKPIGAQSVSLEFATDAAADGASPRLYIIDRPRSSAAPGRRAHAPPHDRLEAGGVVDVRADESARSRDHLLHRHPVHWSA